MDKFINRSSFNSKLTCYLITILLLAAMVVPYLDLTKAFAQEVIDTIRISGSSLNNVAYNPDNKYMYVTNNGQTAYVIDPSDNTVKTTINTFGASWEFAYNPDDKDMYVTVRTSGLVLVIDPADNTFKTGVKTGGSPLGIAYNPDNKYMYVASQNGKVFVIDPADLVIDHPEDNTIKTTIDTGGSPVGIAYNPDNKYMYVASQNGKVFVIDTADNTIKTTINIRDFPIAIAYNPDNKDMYVTSSATSVSSPGGVFVIDPSDNTVKTTINTGSAARGIAYNPNTKDMYGGDFNYGVFVIDPSDNTVKTTINTDGAWGMAYNPDNKYMYVASNGGNVYVIGNTNVFPSNTIITSATDGNGNQVENKGSTVSTSITFQVTATKGTNNIAGFECSLDNSAFSNCATSNPATIKYDNLATDKKHTFQVRAVDTKGNTDLTPAGFEWTVLTPSQAVTKLKDTIVDMHLSKGTTTSLQAPLNSALKQLDKNNNKGACGPLGAFLDQVNEKRSNGQLTSSQAAELRQQATAIQKQIGCSGTAASTASTANSESNSPIENMVNSALSNIGPMQSEQTGKVLDKVQKGLDLYSDFFGGK